MLARKTIRVKVTRVESERMLVNVEDYIWEEMIRNSKLGQDFNPRFVEKSMTYDARDDVDIYELEWWEVVGTSPESAQEKAEASVPIASCVGPHNPTQHRDGKEPWCYICGLTRDYRKPNGKLPGEQLR